MKKIVFCFVLIISVLFAACSGEPESVISETENISESADEASSDEISDAASVEESSEESMEVSEDWGEMQYFTESELENCPLKPSVVFGDGMILQREKKVPVFGVADKSMNGSTVTVNFAGQTQKGKVEKGTFCVYLDPLDANKAGEKLEVICRCYTVTYENVRVGDVYLASGQSNMVHYVEYMGGATRNNIDNDCVYPDLGFLVIDEATAMTRQKTVGKTGWTIPDKSNIASSKISCIAFIFAREIYKQTDVPTGVVIAAMGSSSIQTWISPAHRNGSGLDFTYAPTETCFNGMMVPIIPMASKGFLWYQGEGDSYYPANYDGYLKLLITSTRELFEDEDLPFFTVGLPSYNELDFSTIWNSQIKAGNELENVYTTINYDVGDAADLHPADKLTIANRLANMALEKLCGIDTDNDYPLCVSAEFDGNTVKLTFDCESGIKIKKEDVNSLEVCGKDGKYVRCKASAESENVIAVTADIEEITKIRYGYQKVMLPCDLVSGSGLPAIPFAFGKK